MLLLYTITSVYKMSFIQPENKHCGIKSEGKLSSFLPKKPPSSDTHKKTMLGLVQEESFPMLDPEGDPKGDVIVKDGQPDGIDSEGSGVIAKRRYCWL